jgi:hypothetical protein
MRKSRRDADLIRSNSAAVGNRWGTKPNNATLMAMGSLMTTTTAWQRVKHTQTPQNTQEQTRTHKN